MNPLIIKKFPYQNIFISKVSHKDTSSQTKVDSRELSNVEDSPINRLFSPQNPNKRKIVMNKASRFKLAAESTKSPQERRQKFELPDNVFIEQNEFQLKQDNECKSPSRSLKEEYIHSPDQNKGSKFQDYLKANIDPNMQKTNRLPFQIQCQSLNKKFKGYESVSEKDMQTNSMSKLLTKRFGSQNL